MPWGEISTSWRMGHADRGGTLNRLSVRVVFQQRLEGSQGRALWKAEGAAGLCPSAGLLLWSLRNKTGTSELVEEGQTVRTHWSIFLK